MTTKSETFWQQYKAYRRRVWRRALSDTRATLGLNKTTAWISLITVISWSALWIFFKWTWSELTGQIVPVIAFVIAMIAVGFLILIGRLAAAPVRIDQEQRQAIELARTSGITISQLRGHGDNIQSTYGSPDSWFVLIRDLIIVNRSERDEVVSLTLWWPLRSGEVTFSPQTTPPPNVGQISLITGAENIPARRSITGSLLFKILKTTVPDISVPFLIIIVTSQLTGIERAFNSLTFTEVMKPYPRTLEELNRDLASSKR